ncbi:5-oxoprolinase subunit PxpB [Bacillus sp. FJAT-22090]|uniref:5-oxoprolinase subunit PxpB n=1 Tax=Bacillus sp. FJAT-22090 TaxID=1581038 RepID=UPI001642FD4B|nr:5-oxoprolinase subunit PxpB [Bacillus sp. FJAT-22090]
MKNNLPLVWRTGERTLRFNFGEVISLEIYKAVHSFTKLLNSEWQQFIEEVVPSYHTITVFFYKSAILDTLNIEALLEKWENYKEDSVLSSARQVTIPVCYEEPYCEDITRIERLIGKTKDEIVQLHSQKIYTVYMIGFLPGFPYLGDLDSELFVPRLDKPRLKVPKGTIGIGGNQTGIYPIESPGGWNIIGRTPLEIFSLKRDNPFTLKPGDRLKFSPVTNAEFEKIECEMKNNWHAIDRFIEEVNI